jgi:hypothetical protein
MPGQGLITSLGGGPQKQTRFVSIYTSRWINGLHTNRSVLRGPLDSLYTDFYHMGTTDVLTDGLNSEVSVRNTMIRRPGNVKFSAQNTNAAVDSFYAFHQSNGTIQVIADTLIDVEVVTPSTVTNIFTKASGAGEAYFQGIDKSLYICDGVDFVKYIPSGINNPTTGSPIWVWNAPAPTTVPSLVITQTASSNIPWAALTMFTTMGLLVDSNNNVQQLISVNANGTNPGSQIGTTGSGQPSWNQTPGQTTTEATGTPITWKNFGPITDWTPNTVYKNASVGGTSLNSCIIYDKGSDCCYISAMPSNGDGLSAVTRPPFNGGVNSSFYEYKQNADGSLFSPLTLINKWFCLGGLKNPPVWKPSTAYLSYGGGNDDSKGSISEPVGPKAAGIGTPNPQQVFFQIATNAGTSGTGGTAPKWSITAGTPTDDNQLRWNCLGTSIWAASTPVTQWRPNQSIFSVVKDVNGNLQVCVVSGITGTISPNTADALTAAGNASAGNTTYTGTFPVSLLAGYPVNITGFVTSANNGLFTIVSCNSTTLVVNNPSGVAETHAGTATFNPWGTTYQQTTNDGAATWVCVGTSLAWAASTAWYLPVVGFVPPTKSQPFGGAAIVDTNTRNQFVTNSGKSAAAAPTWNGIGVSTTDSGVTWYCVSAFTAVGFSWTKGMGYCYAFKARKQSDVFVLNAPSLQLSGTNSPNPIGPLGPPTGCADGTVTTASPVIQITGANTGAQILVSGSGSTDPQFDTVEIYRSADGFGASGPYLFLTDIAMPPPVGNQPGTWNIIDFMPDTATSSLPGLNPLVTAPISHVNDPPPGSYGSTQFQAQSAQNATVPAVGTGMIGVVYHQGRLWAHIGNTVFCSGGPDTNPGNGFTAWNPANVFPFQSTVTRLLPTTSGLLVFTTTDLEFIGGGPSITSYYSQRIVSGLGLLSWNALTILGGTPFFVSADRQFLSLHADTGVTRIGKNIGDKLSQFDPSQAYVTYHGFGDQDQALFVSDGSSQWYRCDPAPAPDGKYTGPVWSPKATIAGGFKAVASIETSPGVRQLLIGPNAAGPILARDSSFSTFSDNNAPYSSFFTMGAIMLAHPGQMAQCNFIEMDFVQTGTQPTVSVLFDELSATSQVPFEIISNSFKSDPPKLYGASGQPQTLWMNRYFFSQTTPGNGITQDPVPAWCKFVQVKVDFGNVDTVGNELIGFAINGALWVEK